MPLTTDHLTPQPSDEPDGAGTGGDELETGSVELDEDDDAA